MFPNDVDFDVVTEEIDEAINDIELSDNGVFPYFDINMGDFIFDENGNVKMAKNKEAVKMWIYKIIYTYLHRYEIYYDDSGVREYGTAIKELYLGRKMHTLLMLGVLEQEITEALMLHRKIIRVENFNMDSQRDTLILSFDVILDDYTKIIFSEEVRIPHD